MSVVRVRCKPLGVVIEVIVGGDSAAVAELDLRRFDFQFGGVAGDFVGCLKDLHIDYDRAEERGSGKVGLKFELVTAGYDMGRKSGIALGHGVLCIG